MARRKQILLVFAVLTAAIFAGTGAARGQTAHTVSKVPPGGDALSMAKFYAGTYGQEGMFPGKLVCLRCDLAKGSKKQCEKEGHRHALSMSDGSMIHPLLPGTAEVAAKINSRALHGKKVKVVGRYYPTTAAILVSRIVANQ